MGNNTTRLRVAVRLEGGIGDHILGMRVLYFVRQRFPESEIVVYSDAGGSTTQCDVARLSPHVDRVVSLPQKRRPAEIGSMGLLDNAEDMWVREMRSADVFLDAWGAEFFIGASQTLGVPFYEILARRPEIAVPRSARLQAQRLLSSWKGVRFVGLNLAKYGAECLKVGAGLFQYFLGQLLGDTAVVILNIYATHFDFLHWPQAEAEIRERVVRDEAVMLEGIDKWHDRIVPIRDQSIATVAAVLEYCSYFVGVDNGIKHLAWALDVPRTIFYPEMPNSSFIMRWVPDAYRVLLLHAPAAQLDTHIQEARKCLRAGVSRSVRITVPRPEGERPVRGSCKRRKV
jgi:hypothetical protein